MNTFIQKNTPMRYHCALRIVAVALISAQPVLVHSAESAAIQAFSDGPAASDQLDLEAVGERIRETGAQMREDLRKARARLEAQKAQEAERKREAERARQQAVKDAAAQAAIRDNKQRQAAEAQARRETAQRTQVASGEPSPAQRAKNEKEARERAAKALMEARESAGPKAMED